MSTTAVYAPRNTTGYWLVKTSQGGGVVYATSGSSAPSNAAFLSAPGVNAVNDIKVNLESAIGELGLTGLDEIPTSTIATQAVSNGSAFYTHTPSSAVWDLQPTETLGAFIGAFGAAGLALGGDALAGATGAAATGAGEAGATEAAGGAAAGAGGSGLAGKAASAASTAATKVAAVASGLTLSSLFTSSGTWKGLGMIIAGGLLVLLGLLQMTGRSVGSVVP